MDEEQKEPKPMGRRLKLKRTVSAPVKEEAKLETHAEQAMREVEAEDADRGSAGMNFEVDQGCRSCLMVALLMVVGILVSIFATWIFLNNR